MKPKAPWFDTSCINRKQDQELNQLAKSCGKNPSSQYHDRDTYYEKRRLHRKQKKRSQFFCKNSVLTLN